ncbi:hypothetical protein D1871_09690 [Nakamurella silvestris]|nr:hypothetical protein D1871_09690 [Nakamurella silvestris]
MLIGILGTTTAARDGATVNLGARKTRTLLAALALTPGRPVPVDRIVDTLWGVAPPVSARATVHTYVADLRRSLEPGRIRRSPATVVVTEELGYSLTLPREAFDSCRFEDAVASAGQVLAARLDLSRPVADPADGGEITAVIETLDTALGLWRGQAYADLGDIDTAVAERTRLDELRLAAGIGLSVGRLALGDHVAAAADLDRMTAEHPLHEQIWMLRALALVRSGRQADALAVIRTLRRTLSDQLGIDPNAAVGRLQQAILDQDPGLMFDSRRTGNPAAIPVSPPPPIGRVPHEQAGHPGLIGRDTEFTVLTAGLDGAQAGHPQLVVISGEAGSGKSRLVRELGRAAGSRGFAVLTGRAHRSGGSPDLWPWLPVREGLGRINGEDTGAAEPAVDTTDRFRTWARARLDVEAAAARRPVLILLEDLQWADPATHELLTHLVEHLHIGRVMLVLIHRDSSADLGPELAEALARAHATRVELRGLDEQAVGALATAVAGRAFTSAEVGHLHRRTHGNPGYVTELSRAPEPVTTALPTSVVDLVRRRIAELPPATGALLLCASVIDHTFDLDLLAFAAGLDLDRTLELLEPARRTGVLLDGRHDQFSFSHVLVWEAVLASVDQVARTRWHAAVARGIEEVGGLRTRDQCVALAHHYLQAGYPFAAEGWRAVERAAAVIAVLTGDGAEAGLLADALELQRQDRTASDRERYDLLIRRSAACRAAQDTDGAIACRQEAGMLARRMAEAAVPLGTVVSDN